MAGSFSRQEQTIILDARKWGEYQNYEARQSKFYELLRRIGRDHDGHAIKFAYAIGQNLVLDESDIVDIMGDAWGLSSDEIYEYVF